MAEEKTTTETTTEVVADDAERARAAADQAAAAASSAAALAEVKAANVVQQAADKIATVEGESDQWRNSIQSRHDSLEQRLADQEKRHGETTAQLQSILSRLDKPVESLTNPPQDPPADGEKTTAAPEPEKLPERKRAHRWT